MKAEIVVLAGDGIGPEVVAEGLKVLTAVADRFGHCFDFNEKLIGGCAIDTTGEPLPEETLQACRHADAVLMGAVGGPQWSDPSAPVRPEQGLLRLRHELGLFANLRPIHVYPALWGASPLRSDLLEGVDIMFVRELTGGIYFGRRSEATSEKPEAEDTMRYRAEEVERIVDQAFRLARNRRGKLTSVDKANVLAVSRLWRRVATRVAEAYSDIRLDHVLVDTAAMRLLRCPSDFDVIVTGNMFGDILTDEASMLVGSMGMLPSASLSAEGFGVYEPIHGSAPDIAGRGVSNPLAAILSVAMLLRHSLNLEEEARAVEVAVEAVLERGHRTLDIAEAGKQSVGTEEMGNLVVASL